jgi:hypothetical protein
MGQYHIPVNLTKKQFINPHRLGCGLKQIEQVWAYPGTSTALLVLLFSSNNRGGGDLQADYLNPDEPVDSIIGSWAGDEIAIIGDYSEDTDLAPQHHASTIYDRCHEGAEDGYTDVTEAVAKVIEDVLELRRVGEGWLDWEPKKDDNR